MVSLTRDQALLLFFFPLFFLERGRGGGKKCEKCLTRDMTAKQVRSIVYSERTILRWFPFQKRYIRKSSCLLVKIYMSYCTCVVFKLEGFGQLLSDGNNKLKRSVKCSDRAGVSAAQLMIETATGLSQKLNAELFPS